MNFHCSPWLAAVVASCILGSAPAVQAGAVIATAEEGTFPAVQVQLPGALAQAVSPNNNNQGGSSATATRLRVSASSDGAGAGPSGQFFHAASASNLTDYRLWDFTADAPLAQEEAILLNLSFNFRLVSRLTVPMGAGLDIGNMSYSAQVVSSNSAIVNGRAGNVTYVVGPPDSWSGDLGLLGLVDLSFSLLHDNSSSGQLSMSFGNSATNDVIGVGALWLQSITVTEDLPPQAQNARSSARGFVAAATASVLGGRNVGVRFDNGVTHAFGQDLGAGNPVSEPTSAALVLVALAWFTQRRVARRVRP